MAKILASKDFLERKKLTLKQRCQNLIQQKLIPKMTVILVGKNPASLSYVRNKKKLCQEIGAQCEILELEENISPKDFLSVVEKNNRESAVHGIIIQLPLPNQLSGLDINSLVAMNKDIDGFHPENIKKLYYGKLDAFALLPCTPSGIMLFLQEELKINLTGKNVCVIGRSLIVGKPMVHLLNLANATVVWCHSKTKNLSVLTKQADIIITATGSRHFLDRNYLNPEQDQLVIDVGISGNKQDGIVGDFNSNGLESFPHLSYTPVPGGVGPLTVFKLIDNLLLACEAQLKVKAKI